MTAKLSTIVSQNIHFIQGLTVMRKHKIWMVVFIQCLLALGFAGLSLAENVARLLADAESAFEQKDYIAAESLYTQAEGVEPENYIVLRGLADTKIKLGKLAEAVALLDKVLAMPMSSGRTIIVYLEGETEGLEAELVDENVMVNDNSGASEEEQQFSQFIKKDDSGPVAHYRVYYKKTGKMALLPKNKVRIQYQGIPFSTREQVMALKSEVQKKIISAEAPGKPMEEMVSLPGGCFQMGSENGDPDEHPVHEVCVSAFRIGKYEVQQNNFQALMGVNPSQYVGSDLPVDSVSWDQARDYCEKLGLRLPREAEWEFAARGGTTSEFYWGDTVSGNEGNFCDSKCTLNVRDADLTDGFDHTAPSGSFAPNSFGLYDMAGNVAEWVQDWMEPGYYRVSDKQDPLGPRPELNACMEVGCIGSFSITQKVYRGGAWNQEASEMRSSNRKDSHFQLRAEGTGLRCAGN